eukprot:TRINITY_DN794_c0_g2_i4.p1 TRINITY_DN794_c0_g2~~TRINITY_DN794_c0_g2_i4.p1  ORF type:complete len:491 (-),score=89.98 TRINITY_DN794_c0_g2_i4:52-1524(-)
MSSSSTTPLPSNAHGEDSSSINVLYGTKDDVFLEALRCLKSGHFSVQLHTTELLGVDKEIADTLNEVLDFHHHFCNEIHRMSVLVGKEGKLDERVNIPHTSGSWKECISSINNVISDVVQPTTEVVRVIDAISKGDLSQSIPLESHDGTPLQGEFRRNAELVNNFVDQLNSFTLEVNRVAQEVGSEGKLGGQIQVKGVAGTWKDLADNVNTMVANFTSQTHEIVEVAKSVTNGDLYYKRMRLDVKGESLELKDSINYMVDHLSTIAIEVSRVALEVGSEGKLGGQAEVKGVAGVWRDLIDIVNTLVVNFTIQTRVSSEVTTAVAIGDFRKKIACDLKGECLELKNDINTMVDKLDSLTSEIMRIIHEVETNGKLSSQVQVKWITGELKDLCNSVNQLIHSFESQIRISAHVVSGITNGDFSKRHVLEVKGDLIEYKNMVNAMVSQLDLITSEIIRVSQPENAGNAIQIEGINGRWKELIDAVNARNNASK